MIHVNNDWYNTGIFCHWSCYVYSNVTWEVKLHRRTQSRQKYHSPIIINQHGPWNKAKTPFLQVCGALYIVSIKIYLTLISLQQVWITLWVKPLTLHNHHHIMSRITWLYKCLKSYYFFHSDHKNIINLAGLP